MRSVQRFRSGAPPRLLVSLFALFEGLTILLVALAPGDPFYAAGSPLGGAVIAEVLIIWFLWRGSKVAWWIGLFFAAGAVVIYGYVMLFPDGQLGFGLKAMFAMLLEATAVSVLTAPALERSLGRSRSSLVAPNA